MTLPKEKAEIFARVKEQIKAELIKDPLVNHDELAAKYGIGRSTLSKYARQLGFDAQERRKHNRRAALFAEIQAWLAEDTARSYAMAAEHFKVSASSISYWMIKLNGEPRRKVPTSADHARWVQMFERGNTLRRIAQVTGFNAETIGKALRARGIDTTCGRTPLVEQALQIMAEEGISATTAAARVGIRGTHIHDYKAKRKKKEKQNATDAAILGQFAHLEPSNEHDRPDGNIDKQGDGSRPAGDADVARPRDLRPDEGGQDLRGLEDDHGAKGQAPRQRLRRCG